MHESTQSHQEKPNPNWSLSSDPLPHNSPVEPTADSTAQADVRGQCLLFCNRCGQPSDGRSEFCQRCGAKRCVNCGD